ncbi:MlaD family protein [Candidatus Uabimicrobium sp. HlEnr_7]|uniref:MlaD family protein n=1 Tax=Candidatus Uabimicrobium helgolandensis TaxID=3095367 RepID=UPI003557767A
METNKRDFIVGIVFFVGFVVIALFTIIIKDFTILQGRSAKMAIVFDRVDGLEIGHKVLASGMEVGTVSDLKLQNDGRVKVDINLVEPLNLYEGYNIKVKDASALGGKLIDIHVGDSEEENPQPVIQFPAIAAKSDKVKKLEGKAKHSILDNPEMDELISEMKEVAKSLKSDGTIGLLIRERKIYDDIAIAVKNLREITDSLKNAQGTLGHLLNDDKLYKRLDRISKDVVAITGRVRQGKGTLGRLLRDDKLYQNLKNTMKNADKISQDIHKLTTRINQGEGTIGKLFMDDTLYLEVEKTLREARSMVGNVNSTINGINNGKGTLGMLISDEQMASDLKNTIASLQKVATRLEKGEGTIGKLMADDALYTEIRQLIKSFSDSVEDAREQVPITTFTNILFRAF